MLFTGDYDGTVLHPACRDIAQISDDGRTVRVRAGAGVEWDDLVAWAVRNGLGGIENLSLIPGYVGAAPVQNIGAYGAEAKDTIESVECLLIDTRETVTLSNAECRFGYRDSIFKRELKGRAVILAVQFVLARDPQFRLRYGDVEQQVEALGGVSLENIRRAVIAIRSSKLPDPRVLGNAGSFFKNPVVSQAQADFLTKKYPDMPRYATGEGRVKLAAGWLIDRCGWRVPMKPRYSKEYFARKMSGLSDALLKAECRADDFPNEEHRYYLRMMSSLATDSVGMSFRLEHLLAPYVTFLIMPIFAFANAGVSIDSLEYFRIFHVTPQAGAVGTGIFFGLLVGKPLGIFLASWLAVKTKLAEMPEGAGWKMLFAVACLGGIGFTMSIFVDTLAFADAEIVSRGKIAILMGSFASAVLGTVLIFLFSKKKTRI